MSPPMTAPSIKEALEHARMFIENGVELGYIKMPDADTPDPAHDTLSKITAAIATFQPSGERREAIAQRLACAHSTHALTAYRAGAGPAVEYWDKLADAALASGHVQDEADWRRVSLDRLDKMTKLAHALKRIQKGEADPAATAEEALRLVPWTGSNE